jgi:hypothetical protein
MHRHAARRGDFLRGLPCPQQIAGDDRVKVFAEQRLPERRRLPLPSGVERNVEMTLHPLLRVPRSFSMANQ